MEIAHWKFYAAIIGLVLMIVFYALSESKKVTVKQGKMFNVLAWIFAIVFVALLIFWFFTSKTR